MTTTDTTTTDTTADADSERSKAIRASWEAIRVATTTAERIRAKVAAQDLARA